MKDLLDSDGPGYDSDLAAELGDHARKAARENGLVPPAPPRGYNYLDRVRIDPEDGDRLVELVARGLVPGDEGVVEMHDAGGIVLASFGDQHAFVRPEDLALVRASTDAERRHPGRKPLELP